MASSTPRDSAAVADSSFCRGSPEFATQRAVLMISHRAASLRWCERIYVLADGRVERCGTWSELCADTEGWFTKVFALQRLESDAAR